MNQPRTWIMIANAAEIRVFHNTGAKVAHQAVLSPVEHGVFHHQVRREDSEPRSQQWLESFVAWLGEPAQTSRYEHLIIVAPDRTLGAIREALGPRLSSKVVREVHGDLVKLPIKEIEDHVAAYLNPVGAPPVND